MDDVGIPEILWELAIDPEYLEQPGKVSDKVSPPALNTSAGIPSGPGALPVCSCLMAASTSAVLGGASSSGIMGRC